MSFPTVKIIEFDVSFFSARCRCKGINFVYLPPIQESYYLQFHSIVLLVFNRSFNIFQYYFSKYRIFNWMGSDQSSLPAGVPGSNLRSQRDEDIPYTTYSISKPIDGVAPNPYSDDDHPDESPRASPRSHNRHRHSQKGDREGTPKHDIVVVTECGPMQKDPDPELTKLNAIPVFHPVIKRSVNGNRGEMEFIEKLDHRQVLLLCIRYQEHLKQLSEAVAFDQNALCIRVKEIDSAKPTQNEDVLPTVGPSVRSATNVMAQEEASNSGSIINGNCKQTRRLFIVTRSHLATKIERKLTTPNTLWLPFSH
ncbi:BORCS5 [Acanthosepion pharaonis]|uniref:BLOC-1-related complex subunit 5 n=1 Tax=Acanthosepion pharaonis TaxID=158019 RepID=A0A812CGX9_ACAPH|nr:BORCS5 [Sepia pharaonis]